MNSKEMAPVIFQYYKKLNADDGSTNYVRFNPSITNYPIGNVTAIIYKSDNITKVISVGYFTTNMGGQTFFNCDNPFSDGVGGIIPISAPGSGFLFAQ